MGSASAGRECNKGFSESGYPGWLTSYILGQAHNPD